MSASSNRFTWALSALLWVCPQSAVAQGEWTSLGPGGGPVNTIAVDPSNPSIVYAGTSRGVFRSTDGGASWTERSTGLPSKADISVLAVDPVNPTNLYAGFYSGVFRSTDAGASWSMDYPTGLPPAPQVATIAIDPATPATVFAGTRDGVYRSTDAGVTWTARNAGLSGRYIYTLVVDPVTPTILYAGGADFLHRSADGGASWTARDAGLPDPVYVSRLAIDPATPETLYAGTLGTGVFRSTDGGANWTARNGGLPSVGVSVYSMAIDPVTPATLYIGVQSAEGTRVYRSTDAGATWVPSNAGLPAYHLVVALAIDPATPTTIHAGTWVAGVFRSVDAGSTWASSNTGLALLDIYAIAVDPSIPTTLYVSDGIGLNRSADGGASWLRSESGLPDGPEVHAVVIDPVTPTTLYAGIYGGTGRGVYRSTDGGANWTPRNTGLPPNPSVDRLAIDPLTPTTLYAAVDAGSLGGVYRSRDAGAGWTACNNGLPHSPDVLALAVDPRTPTTLYAGIYADSLSGVYRSTDSGATWTAASTGLPAHEMVTGLAIDPRTPLILYAGTWLSGVFRTTDAGKTWTSRSNGLPSFLSAAALVIDPVAPATLYVGGYGGVFGTTDGGATWENLNTGFPYEEVSVLAVDPLTPGVVYAGTYGRSAWRYGVPDVDSDGLPTGWEDRYGLGDYGAAVDGGPAGDPDRDGMTNLQEYRNGTHPRGFFTRYFAEGATGTFFDDRFALLNLSETTTAHVLVRFQKRDGSTASHALVLGAHTRGTVDVESLAGMSAAEFSTVVESDQPLVPDRTMTWNESGYGSHAETALLGPATTWYLAEGATHFSFNLYYLIQNPNDQTANVEVTYLRPEPNPTIVKTYPVKANSRFNILVDKEGPELAATDVSAVLRSDLPVIVERAMYLDQPGPDGRLGTKDDVMFAAGHESAGVTAPATEWFLAEGATGRYFDLFVLIANPPGETAAAVTATFLLPKGPPVVKSYAVAPGSRFTIWVDTQDPRLADTAVSTIITSTNGVPVIVERAMWWPGPTAATWAEAHNSAGLTATGKAWALAEGEVGGSRGAETYILIANRGAADTARVTLLYEDGTRETRDFGLEADSRTNVAPKSDFPNSRGRRFGAIVEALDANAEIVVERAMYSSAGGVSWAAGTNAVAACFVPALNMGFGSLVGDGSPFSTYAESGFTVTATSGAWTADTTFGHPAPFVSFTRLASEPDTTAGLEVTAGGSLFTLGSLDLFSSVTTIPYEIVGLRDGATVFTVSGTEPNPHGSFATLSNPYPAGLVDTVRIRLTNPEVACCANHMGVDNIMVRVATYP